MLKGFLNILVKELKELIRDPKILLGMIVVPLIMFPLLGVVISFSMQSAQEKAEGAAVLVVNNDGGNWSKIFIDFLNFSMKTYVESNVTLSSNAVLDLMSRYNTTRFIEIPAGFSVNMTSHLGNATMKASVDYYGVFSGGGIFESIGSSMIDNIVYRFNRYVAPDALYAQKSTVIKGEIKEGIDPAFLTSLTFSQTIVMPIIIIILLQFSMQIAATSVAMEKEEKTLETLISLPIDRFTILVGKLSGSILVAAAGALAFMFGFNFYIGSFMGNIPVDISMDLVSLGLVPSAGGYLLLGISLFVTLISALALAVIISAFAEDVRGAQSIVGFIYPLVLIPSLLLMFTDINSLPLALRIALYAIPFSHTTIAAKTVTMGEYWTPSFGIMYVAVFTILIMYAASRLFATEKILTAKLRFRWFRKRTMSPSRDGR